MLYIYYSFLNIHIFRIWSQTKSHPSIINLKWIQIEALKIKGEKLQLPEIC